LGCRGRSKRVEFSAEILGKDQHIPHWLRKRQRAESENCSIQQALQDGTSDTRNQTSPMKVVLRMQLSPPVSGRPHLTFRENTMKLAYFRVKPCIDRAATNCLKSPHKPSTVGGLHFGSPCSHRPLYQLQALHNKAAVL